jgi:HSP20 family protein
MGSITVRKDNNTNLPQTASIVRDPDTYRAMRDLLRWDPFREMAPTGFFGVENLFNALPAMPAAFNPAFEVKEIKDAYLFKADVPGLKEGDIEVTATGNRLTVAGNRNEEKEEQAETYYACECRYGSFSRSYTLPEGADMKNIHADLKDGVLTIAVPKLPEVQPKKIAVKAAPSKA